MLHHCSSPTLLKTSCSRWMWVSVFTFTRNSAPRFPVFVQCPLSWPQKNHRCAPSPPQRNALPFQVSPLWLVLACCWLGCYFSKQIETQLAVTVFILIDVVSDLYLSISYTRVFLFSIHRKASNVSCCQIFFSAECLLKYRISGEEQGLVSGNKLTL